MRVPPAPQPLRPHAAAPSTVLRIRQQPALLLAAMAVGLLSACSTVDSVGQYLGVSSGAAPAAKPSTGSLATATLPPFTGSGRELYRGRYSYVRAVPTELGAATSAPVLVDRERFSFQLKQLLGAPQASFSDRPLFSRDEAAEIAPQLSAALSNGHSGEDILFAVSGHHKPLALSETASVTTGRLFVADGRLNIIFGMTRVNFGDELKASGTLRRFDQGSRQAALSTAEPLVGGDWAPVVPGRVDWMALPLESVGILPSSVPTASSTVLVPNPTAGGNAPMMPAAPAASHTPATAVTPASGAAPATDADSVERRLGTLERLRQKGLITPQEYDAKRRAIIDGL